MCSTDRGSLLSQGLNYWKNVLHGFTLKWLRVEIMFIGIFVT